MEMEWMFSDLNKDLNNHSQDLGRLVATPRELPRKRQENQRPRETLEFLKLTQTAKDTHTGVLYQQSMGRIKIEQNPATVGGRTTHRAPSPKRTPFQTDTSKQSQVQKVSRKTRLFHSSPMRLLGNSLFKISSHGSLFNGIKWLP